MYTITCSDCNGNSCIIFDFFFARTSPLLAISSYTNTHINNLCTKAKYIGTKHVYTQHGNYKLFSDIATPKTITVSVTSKSATNEYVWCVYRVKPDKFQRRRKRAQRIGAAANRPQKLRKIGDSRCGCGLPLQIFLLCKPREIKRIDATKMPTIFEDVHNKNPFDLTSIG